MKIAEKKLIFSDPDFCTVAFGESWICRSGIRELFDVPYKAKKLWVVLHDRPARDRIEITNIRNQYMDLDGERRLVFLMFYSWICKFMKERELIYAEFWYE